MFMRSFVFLQVHDNSLFMFYDDLYVLMMNQFSFRILFFTGFVFFCIFASNSKICYCCNFPETHGVHHHLHNFERILQNFNLILCVIVVWRFMGLSFEFKIVLILDVDDEDDIFWILWWTSWIFLGLIWRWWISGLEDEDDEGGRWMLTFLNKS